jgi:ABC-type spermidine/putrescine transport system permease subunit II
MAIAVRAAGDVHAPIRPRGGRWATLALRLYAVAVYAFLYLPIAVIVLFSFSSNRIPTWPIEALTLDWYREAFGNAPIWQALRTSLLVATAVGVISCVVGLLAAKELAFRSFRGKGLVLLVILIPLIVPLLAFGLASYLLFDAAHVPLGTFAVILAHCVFGISFATLILYSRLLDFRRSLLEAAASLGASPTRVFLEVLVPVAAPGLLAAFLLAFLSSFDEFIVAFFVIGFDETLPVAIWSQLRNGVNPQINAIATLVLALTITLAVVAQWSIARGGRRR